MSTLYEDKRRTASMDVRRANIYKRIEVKLREKNAQRKPLTDEMATLQAVSDEYNAWIHAHAAGIGYDDFLKQRIAAHGIKEQA